MEVKEEELIILQEGAYNIPIERQACHFGGFRYFFIVQSAKQGCACFILFKVSLCVNAGSWGILAKFLDRFIDMR